MSRPPAIPAVRRTIGDVTVGGFEALRLSIDETAISSPFPPHLPHLGSCGAHFVGLNANSTPWNTEGRPAVEYLADHWRRHRPAIYRRVGLAPPEVHST